MVELCTALKDPGKDIKTKVFCDVEEAILIDFQELTAARKEQGMQFANIFFLAWNEERHG